MSHSSSNRFNLLDHPERSPRNRRLRREWRAADRPGISRDTPLMPWVVAEAVCAEASNFLNSEVPLRYIDALDAKAERCYARGARKTAEGAAWKLCRQFRRLVRQRDNAGRANLYAFMRHWLYAWLVRDERALALRLPVDFSVGEVLNHRARRTQRGE